MPVARSGAGSALPVLLAGLVALGVAGCASPGKPVTQTLWVDTPGCAPARCELSNDAGHWLLPATPGALAVTTSHQALRVVCRSANATQGEVGAASSMTPAGASGAVVGGAVGAGVVVGTLGTTALAFIPVLGVIAVVGGTAMGALGGQALSEGAQRLLYPERIVVAMNCQAAATSVAAAGPDWGLDIRSILPADAQASGLEVRGAVQVTAVAVGSLAAAAGLRPGDLVLAAGTQPVVDVAGLAEKVLALAATESLTLTVWRGGQTLALVLTRPLAVRP